MKQIQWTKMAVDYILDPRIFVMLRDKYGFVAFTLLIVLRQLAAKVNKHGYVYLTENEPMTAKCLATFIGKHTNTIEKGLDCLDHLGFIQRDENGVIYVCDWDGTQNLDKYEQYLENSKNRVAAYRKRQHESNNQEGPVTPAEPEVLDAKPLPEGVDVVYIHTDEEKQTVPEATLEEPSAKMAPPETVQPMQLVKSVNDATGPEPSPAKTSEVVKYYQQSFGMIGYDMITELLEMEKKWGGGAVCAAIRAAR